jgi:hypothetical protein
MTVDQAPVEILSDIHVAEWGLADSASTLNLVRHLEADVFPVFLVGVRQQSRFALFSNADDATASTTLRLSVVGDVFTQTGLAVSVGLLGVEHRVGVLVSVICDE